MNDDQTIIISEDRQYSQRERSNNKLIHHLVPYAQLSVNVAFVALFFYFGYNIFSVIHKDVDMKLEIERLKHERKIEQCKKNYEINECNPESRVRALDDFCEEWLHCMTLEGVQGTDSRFSLKRGVLWAETFGEVINAFVGSIHIRTWFILIFTISSFIFITNLSFGWLRIYLTNADKKNI